MTDQELTEWVRRISLRDFKQPFVHTARFNARLKTTGGRFHLKDQHLDFNPSLFASSDEATQVGIIRHELAHYHLFRAHRGYQHRDRDFKLLLKAVGGLRYAPATQSWRYRYRCKDCEQEYRRQRRIDTRKYRCGRCRGRLALVEEAT